MGPRTRLRISHELRNDWPRWYFDTLSLDVVPYACGILYAVGWVFWLLVSRGDRSAGAVLLTESYSTVSNYSLIVVPMFVLLGNISSAAGFSHRLYDAAFAWVGRLTGGLASASVLGCAASQPSRGPRWQLR